MNSRSPVPQVMIWRPTRRSTASQGRNVSRSCRRSVSSSSVTASTTRSPRASSVTPFQERSYSACSRSSASVNSSEWAGSLPTRGPRRVSAKPWNPSGSRSIQCSSPAAASSSSGCSSSSPSPGGNAGSCSPSAARTGIARDRTSSARRRRDLISGIRPGRPGDSAR